MSVELFTSFPPSQLSTIRETVLADTLAFAREVCGFRIDDQTGLPSLTDEVHGPLCAFLAKPGRRKMVLMARDSYKTSVVTVARPLQLIARDPNTRILLDSDLLANSKKWAGMIRWNLEFNPRFHQLFGHLKREPGWTDEFFTVVRAREFPEPTIMTSGMDRTVVGLHFPLCIADDLVTEQNTVTKDQRDKTMRHIQLLRPILGSGDLVLVGTRWDDDDAYGRILRDESGGRKIADIMDELREFGEAKIGRWLVFFRDCYGPPGIRDVAHREAAYYARGYGLVHKFTPEYLTDARIDMGEYQFSANYAGDPIPQSTAMFKKEWVEHYWEPPLPTGLQVTIVVDPALSDAPRSSFSAITAVGYDPPTRHRYVLYAWHGKVGELELGRQLLEIYEALVNDGLHVYAIAVEEVALQGVYRSIFLAEAERRGILTLPLRKLRKEVERLRQRRRVQALAPLFEQLLFWLRPDQVDLVDELARYPKGSSTDLVVTLAYQLDLQRNLSNLVYPMFDPDRHVIPATSLPKRFDRLAAALRRPTVGDDFGLVVMGRANRAWYVLEETIIPRGSSNTDLLTALYAARTTYKVPTAKIYLSPEEVQLRTELVRMKFTLRLARAFRDPVVLHSRLATMIDRDRLFVGAHCEELVREFGLFSWPEQTGALSKRPDRRYAKLLGAVELIIWQEEPPERQNWSPPKDPFDEATKPAEPARRPYPTGYGFVRGHR